MNNLLIKFHEKTKYFLLVLLIILFPINQQLHLKPFPNIEGVIIDYLMVKISIPEVILIILSFFNINWILKFLKENLPIIRKNLYLIVISFAFVVYSILKSNYLFLAIYENLILLLLLLNSFTFIYFQKLDFLYLLKNSVKFWLFSLLVLGLFQVYFQESVLDNYYYFGEFIYSSDNYHIKQNGLIFKNMIPAYGIFSHPNIYGAFFLICCMFLTLIKEIDIYTVLISLVGIVISGSLNILLGFLVFFFFYYIKLRPRYLLLYPIILIIFLNIMSLNFQNYSSDLSVYRRLYMVNISNSYFLSNPLETIFGFGYYNYFKIVSEDLYFYEIIRFIQPPHNVLYLMIWNYGLIFVLAFLILLFKLIKKAKRDFQLMILVLFSISMFDHFLCTNHQLKMLLFLIIPYSLNRVFSIKIK